MTFQIIQRIFSLRPHEIYFFFEGNTERSILNNIADIVDKSLPMNKVSQYYQEVKGVARDAVLGYVAFLNDGKTVSRVS